MTISGRTIPLSRTDLWRLGASLVLAIILWGTITAANNPERSKTFPAVDITAAHLDSSLQIVGSLPQASIALSGPRTDMTKITSGNVTASLDMKNIHSPGDYRLSVDVDHPGSVWKTTVSPSTILVHVDKTASKEFPLEVKIVGSTGSTQQVVAVTPTINTVTVKGPADEVDTVAKVVASVQIGNQSRDFTDSFTPVAIDANGDPLPNVQVSPGTVPINVQITARGKNVAVITQLIGDPAPGYEVVDRTINPSTVIVDGPADMLATLISVSTEPVDVTNATNTLQKQVKLVGLPDGVNVIDPADGTVAVVVQIAERGVRQPLPSQDVNVVNVGSGLTAEVSPRAVSVTVVASDATIAKLTASDVIVQINAAGLGPGTYSLSPIVALPSSISWVSTDPPMVTVTIKAATGTTPTSSASPAATPAASLSPSPTS